MHSCTPKQMQKIQIFLSTASWIPSSIGVLKCNIDDATTYKKSNFFETFTSSIMFNSCNLWKKSEYGTCKQILMHLYDSYFYREGRIIQRLINTLSRSNWRRIMGWTIASHILYDLDPYLFHPETWRKSRGRNKS